MQDIKDQNAVALVAKRKKYNKICPICKEKFVGIKVKVFCSEKCKQTNKRKKADQAKRGEHFRGIE